jgi:probable HAF family extracellular repeat protein
MGEQTMSFHSWLQKLRSELAQRRCSITRRASRRAARHRPSLEVLENRCVPALYAVTDLGLNQVVDINQAGQAVGSAYAADGTYHAAVWDNGSTIDLGTLGGSYSFANGINDLGQVVGYSDTPDNSSLHAFLVTPQDGAWFQDSNLDGINDFMIDLGSLNGSSQSVAGDINNAGQVIGSWGVALGRPFYWDSSSGMIDLGVPPGFTYSNAGHINEMGQVTVYAYDSVSGQNSAFLWDAAHGMTALGAGPGYTQSYATSLNDAGQATGYQWNGSSDSSSVFLWTPDAPNGLTGSFTDLGALPGAVDSVATNINNAGQIVGYCYFVESVYVCDCYCDEYGCYDNCYYQDTYVPHAFIWDAAGGMVDLQNQLLPGSDVTLQYAEAINDDGVIAVNGAGGAYLLTPSDMAVVSVSDAPAVTEGNVGAVAVNFTVTLSAPSTKQVTIDYATADGSATAGSDYQAASGTLTFAPGDISKTVTVLINGDRVAEPTEAFYVNLSSPTNAVIADGQGMGTIIDDEPQVSITPAVSHSEGNTGQTPFAFAVTLSSAYDVPVSVVWATANGTATAGSDYQAASGTLIIPAGQTTGTITVQVNGDRLAEPNETFVVNLTSATYASITNSQGTGTILDDEPRISISDVSKKEGKKNQTTLFTFTVTLSAAYDQAVTMSFHSVDGTATTHDKDYVAQTGTLTFKPGETTKTITIVVNGDNKKENDEMFDLDLIGNSSNSLFTKSRGIGTILNDD